MTFAFDSLATHSAHEWTAVDAAGQEVREARIVSGMHFRTSNLAGKKLGADVARRVARRLDERR